MNPPGWIDRVILGPDDRLLFDNGENEFVRRCRIGHVRFKYEGNCRIGRVRLKDQA